MAYSPTPKAEHVEVDAWVFEELLRISQEFQNFLAPLIILTVNYAAPIRPRDGMVVHADGATWNPGGGKGLYLYSAGAWVKL